ncbi:tetratricopeptide repeat-containing protein [Priestia megaterium]|uniref:tetratricopeptide repeat-containing protein n=1 Tax=Priestia megaterium TaxID=1404 RepID=UPI002ACD884D|nr:tetratricopeptide repeat-containing protein [Priestia megaterium]
MKGYSKLTEDQKHELSFDFIPDKLLGRIQKYQSSAKVFNTWGDAVIAVFLNGLDAVEFMLAYRDTFNKENLGQLAISPRIAGHYGEIHVFYDHLLKQDNAVGKNVDTTARIEPITRPGEIFVTAEFRKAFLEKIQRKGAFKFSRLGKYDLAKNFGSEELYRLYRCQEKEQIVDSLFEQEITDLLPELGKLTEQEEKIIEKWEKGAKRSEAKAWIDDELTKIHSQNSAFLESLSKICKDYGFYKEGLRFVEELERNIISISEGIKLKPYVSKKEVMKIKAECLTRLGKYEQAASILYSLWQSISDKSSKDAYDILSMLAAQFKRRAMVPNDDRSQQLSYIDIKLLKSATDLYLAAFKVSPDEYYPAINAAYLYKIIEKVRSDHLRIENGTGTKLAEYIIETWGGESMKSNWWLDATIAEAFMLKGDFQQSLEDFQHALKKHKYELKMFEVEGTKIQIEQYLKIMHLEREGKEIVELLEYWINNYKVEV